MTQLRAGGRQYQLMSRDPVPAGPRPAFLDYHSLMRELTLPGRLMLLPGVGTTPDFYQHQRDAFGPDVITPDWIAPVPGESAGRYAQRWAEQLNPTLHDDGRPFFIGGASFGGILALEMAPHLKLKPATIFLIASTRHHDGLPRRLKFVGNLASKLPPDKLKTAAKLAAVPFSVIDGLDDPGLRAIQKMIKAIDPQVLHWSVGASVEWVNSDPGRGVGSPPVRHIHGEKDRIIPAKSAGADTLIEHGGHSLTLMHDTTVNRWLFNQAMRMTPEPEPKPRSVPEWRPTPVERSRVLGW